MDIQKEREAFNKEFGIDDADTFPAFSGGIENSAALKCNWLGWKKRAEFEYRENPETIEIDGLKTIHKLCKFGADHNMEGCTFTEIVERMFDELSKAQAVPEWIETAIQPPEEGQEVIISGIYGVGMAEFSYLYKDEFVMYDMGASNPILSKDQVKFWQPLPDAPQEPAND